MKDLEVTKIVLDKYKIRYHELQEKDYTYIQPFSHGDISNYLYVNGHLHPLKQSGQFSNFMEFLNGDLVSY